MRSLNFKYVLARNFLCFGPEGIELKFDEMGNIILIRGENLDVKPDDGELEPHFSDNGTGKSSLFEVISYCIFGKTIKSPKKIKINDPIHNRFGKKLYTEVVWNNYRVVRTRKTDSLRIWESETLDWNTDTEITLSKSELTQELILEKFGLSYDTFVNTCVFTDDIRSCFLECNDTVKREIVENLLGLDKYRGWAEVAKKMYKATKSQVESLSGEYSIFIGTRQHAQNRITQINQQTNDWKSTKLREIKSLMDQIKLKTAKLSDSNYGPELQAYNEAQDQIKLLEAEMPAVEKKQENRTKTLQEAQRRIERLNEELQKLSSKLNASKQETASLEVLMQQKEAHITLLLSKKHGVQCPECFGIIEERNIDHAVGEDRKAIEKTQEKLDSILNQLAPVADRFSALQAEKERIQGGIAELQKKLTAAASEMKVKQQQLHAYYQIKEPVLDQRGALLQQEVVSLKKQAAEKKAEYEGPSPYISILDSAQSELVEIEKACAAKKQEIEDIESDLPFYQYWQQAFGDNGIRRWVIDGIIPSLNSRIEYWLQFLINGKISLTFNNMLEEEIHRNPPDGDPYVYHAMSQGERRRLNIAVSQAFAHVMMASAGISPSIIFLDEISTNVDRLGVQGLYNMISELSQEKQVFMTTHDPFLFQMLEGAEILNLRKENGISKIVN